MDKRDSSSPSALLVEFAAVGRYILGVELPYLYSLMKNQLGIQVQWLRFGLDPAVQYRKGEAGIGLDDQDLGTLLEQVARCSATHVVFSHTPATSLWQNILAEEPDLSASILASINRSVPGRSSFSSPVARSRTSRKAW